MCAHGEDLCRVEGDALAEQLKVTAFHVAEFDGRKEGGATLASRRAPRNMLRFKRTMPVLWAPRRYSVTPAGRCLEAEAHVVAAAVFTPVERVLCGISRSGRTSPCVWPSSWNDAMTIGLLCGIVYLVFWLRMA